MHSLKFIRNDPDFFKRKINERNTKIDIEKILELAKENRKIIQKKEKLEQEKKIISKKRDKTQFTKSKEISLEVSNLDKQQIKIQKNIEMHLSSLPNIALDEVPIGIDEN